MKKLEDAFELFDGVIPSNAEKTIIFCEVEKTAYEIFYYSFFQDGSCKHSSELIDAGEFNSADVENVFDKVAKYIRESEPFDTERRNVITITAEGSSEKVEIEKFEKKVGLYKIKKEWKAAHL